MLSIKDKLRNLIGKKISIGENDNGTLSISNSPTGLKSYYTVTEIGEDWFEVEEHNEIITQRNGYKCIYSTKFPIAIRNIT